MLIPSKFSGYHNGTRQLHISSGGGGGGTTQTTSTVQNTNIPEYAKSYVENMLGATQEQLFQGYRTPTSVDPTTGQTTGGEFNITGFKPYQAYGGTYDAQGNQLSYDPSKGIAGFSPMQIAAQQGISDLTLPQEMQDASEATKLAFHDARRLGQGYQASTYTGQDVNAPGLNQYQMGPIQGINAANAGMSQLGSAPTYSGQQLSYRPQDIGYQQVGAERVQAMPLDKYQMQAARDISTGSFTQPGTADQYMSPYMQSVVNTQQREAQRKADIAAQSRGAAAARSGAFGGSRQAIENAEAARNLATQKSDIQAQGLQSAFQQAQQQYNTEQQTALQAALANQQTQQQTGVQNLSALLQTQGLAAQTGLTAQTSNQQAALQAALANQAAGIDTSKFNQQQQYNTALQNAQLAQQQQLANQALQGQYGLTQGQMNQTVNLANQAAQNQAAAQNQQMAYNVGQQNLAANLGIQQLGAGQNLQAQLANQQNRLANQQLTEQAKQFGGQYGLQANAQALGAANQYGALGNQMLQAQQGIYGLQNQVGGQQQAYQQSILNQAIQDYANAQQYPLMQLGTMSNMLRGLPMQASTTNQYAASPNPLSQAIGTIGAGASIYNAYNPTGRGASGGLPKEFKFAKGGITSVPGYDMGGEVESQLENMGEEQLAKQVKESSSPSIRRMAQRILRERQMGNKPQAPGMRGGGIIAFQQGGGGNGVKSAIEEGGEENAKIDMEKRLAMPPSTTPPPGGIMGATTPPVTPVPTAPQAGRAMQQAPDIPAFMKAEYADAERRMNAPLSDFMAERKAAMQEAGVADASEGQQKLRAELMAEKANMGEERERQKNLRMAEFFASWGSTPGPVLVAGLNALQKTVPNIISDEKEQKKARREIDKSIADLDNATRLEKRGEVDAAMALKLKAAEDMKALNMKFIDYQSRRESDASAAAASKYTADAHLRAEEIRATTARLDRIARRENEDDNKRFGQYQAAAQQEQRLISKIVDQAKLLEKDYETIKTAEMNAKQNEGKMAPALVPGYEAAKKKITEQEAIWNKQKEQAARDTNLAYERVRIMPQAAKDYTKPSTAAPAAGAPSAGPVSGEFSAPTEAHINALKANPEQAAAFDVKFGPGAANEYLGK